MTIHLINPVTYFESGSGFNDGNAVIKMALGEKFDYEQFRQQAVEQLRTGPINLASIKALLAPVIQDLLEMALQQDEQPIVSTSEGAKPSAFTEPAVNLDQFVESPDDTTSRVSPMRVDHSTGQSGTHNSRVNHYVIEYFYQGVPYKSIQRLLDGQGLPLSLTSLMKITDQGLPRTEAWHKRPLSPIYAFLYVTSLPFQLRQDNHLGNRSAYVVVAIDLQGRRDILGYYVGERDLARTWSTVLADLQARGVKDILIACGEEPTSLREAFTETYPQTHVHGCMMLHMRTSLRSMKVRDKQAATKILRALYTVSDQSQATEIWQAFRTDWAEQYSLLVENWERNWHLFTGPMQYPSLVARRAQRFNLLDIIDEAMSRHLKENGPYANELEFFKSTFIISQRIVSKHKGGMKNWGLLVEQLSSVFGDRIKKHMAT